jgi:hypothetical protein
MKEKTKTEILKTQTSNTTATSLLLFSEKGEILQCYTMHKFDKTQKSY